MFWVALLALFGILVFYGYQKSKKLAAAKAAYKDSLARLKRDCTNADLKEETLALGRAYSSLTRDSKGVTIFDEVALSNDISAACAAAARQNGSPAPSSGVPSLSIDDRLARLSELQRKGLIERREYEDKRAQIMSEL